MDAIKQGLLITLKKLEPYVKTDMVYVGKSGFWLGVGQLFGILISFALSILFANFISKEVFGVYKYILSLAGFVGAFYLNGMGIVITKAVAEGRDWGVFGTFKTQFLWAIPQVAISLALAVYYFAHNNLPYAIALAIIALCVPVISVTKSFTSYLYGKQDFATATVYSVYGTATYAAVMAVAIFWMPQMVWLITAYYGSNTIASMYLCYRTYKKYPTASTQPPQEDVSYSKHLSYIGVGNAVAQQFDSILVYHLLGPAGPTQLAIYTFAILLPDRVRGILGTISTALLPKFAQNKNTSQESMNRKSLQLLGVSIFLVAIYITLAPLVFELIFPQYMDAVRYSQYYALSLIALPSQITLTSLFARANKKALYILNVGIPTIKIFISFIAIFVWGVAGAVAARIGYLLIQALVSVFFVTTTPSPAHEGVV